MYGRVPAFEIGHDEDTPRSHRRAGYSPARVAARLQNIVQSQGLGLLLGIFGVFFVFVFVPVFVVDDLLYVRTVAPEYDRKSRKRPSAGQEKSAKFPTSKAPLSAGFHSFRLIFGRAIISRNGLEAWMLFPERARAEHSC